MLKEYIHFNFQLDLESIPVIEICIFKFYRFEFPQSRGSWKTVATVSASGEKAPNEDVELDSSFIEAPNKFSFSCGDLVLNPLNKTGPYVGIRFKGFQVSAKMAF